MQLDDSTLPFIPAWEGRLTAAPTTFTLRGTLPRASIGRPHWWPGEQLLGDKWRAPAGGARYGLARFPFSLRPEGNQRVQRVEFHITLAAENGGPAPIAFDAYPQAVHEEQEGNVTLGIGPDFKLGEIEASLAKAEASLTLKRAVAVITLDGLGESTVRWVYRERARHPLEGSQVVYLVVELPVGVSRARASVRLMASMNTALGWWIGVVPQEAEAKLEFVL